MQINNQNIISPQQQTNKNQQEKQNTTEARNNLPLVVTFLNYQSDSTTFFLCFVFGVGLICGWRREHMIAIAIQGGGAKTMGLFLQHTGGVGGGVRGGKPWWALLTSIIPRVTWPRYFPNVTISSKIGQQRSLSDLRTTVPRYCSSSTKEKMPNGGLQIQQKYTSIVSRPAPFLPRVPKPRTHYSLPSLLCFVFLLVSHFSFAPDHFSSVGGFLLHQGSIPLRRNRRGPCFQFPPPPTSFSSPSSSPRSGCSSVQRNPLLLAGQLLSDVVTLTCFFCKSYNRTNPSRRNRNRLSNRNRLGNFGR